MQTFVKSGKDKLEAMNNFDRFNFKVVPCNDNKQPAVQWSLSETWCDWEEREEIYPGYKNWYVVPSRYVTYEEDGIDWKVYVIDIDNHDGDKFQEAKKYIQTEWNLPLDTLIIKTPSGGLHIYYRSLADYTPATVDFRKVNGLPIEVKSNVGVVAPNGIDRIVVRDEPIKILNPIRGTRFGDDIECIRKRKNRKVVEYHENPNFNINMVALPDVPEGSRHRTAISTVQRLKENGCPRDKALNWARQFYEKNNRIPQRNEIENLWEWDSGEQPETIKVKGKQFRKVA